MTIEEMETAIQRWIESDLRQGIAPKIRLCSQPRALGIRKAVTCRNCVGKACAKLHAIGLNDMGEALPTGQRPRCGAATRNGTLCKMPVVAGKRRCRLHGGASTGPKTREGRARISEAMKKRRAVEKV